MSYIITLRKALEDPALTGIECIVPEERTKVNTALEQFPDAQYISEWRFEQGSITYQYHIHDKQIGESLKRLFAQGKVGRHPTLTAVYAVSKLDSILVGSGAYNDPNHA